LEHKPNCQVLRAISVLDVSLRLMTDGCKLQKALKYEKKKNFTRMKLTLFHVQKLKKQEILCFVGHTPGRYIKKLIQIIDFMLNFKE
jgi:hypothetical protein